MEIKGLKEAAEKIRSAYNIVIACHVNPDGDAIGSLVSLGLGLKQMGKEVVYLHVTSGNPAQQLYESLGFKIKESRWVILKEYNS